MSQLSRPLLVVLGLTVALMALWLTALRPKPVALQDTPLAPTQAIPQAEQATGVAAAANAKVQPATGDGAQAAPGAAATAPGASGSTPASAAAPGAATATPNATAPVATNAASTRDARAAGERRDAAVMRDVARGKIVVLLFWNPTAADDVATRSALRSVDRRGGRVVVRVIPISRVADYESITQDVKIAQSPTTVIVGRKGRTRAIVGFAESHEMSQAVADALAGR